jgi:hypothetical protein
MNTNHNSDTNHGRTNAGLKAATKTTEFMVYVAMVLATVITALAVGENGEGETAGDPFNAALAMQFITYLTIGYMLARGLAKSGNRNTTTHP